MPCYSNMKEFRGAGGEIHLAPGDHSPIGRIKQMRDEIIKMAEQTDDLMLSTALTEAGSFLHDATIIASEIRKAQHQQAG